MDVSFMSEEDQFEFMTFQSIRDISINNNNNIKVCRGDPLQVPTTVHLVGYFIHINQVQGYIFSAGVIFFPHHPFEELSFPVFLLILCY